MNKDTNTANEMWDHIVAITADRDRLRDALTFLIERCQDSDDNYYGTLSTSFVKDIAREALEAQ